MHGHDHKTTAEQSGGRLAIAVTLNLALGIAQVVGGLIAGSLALVADALHNLSDAASLVVALLARRIAGKPADEKRTFGYRRAEVIGAAINLSALIFVALYLDYEAIARFFSEKAVEGWIVVLLAGGALAVDVMTALLTYAQSRHSLNIKAAFVHNVSDGLASIAVLVAGSLILLYHWYWADLVATLLISSYALYQGITMLPRVVNILMEGAPTGLDLQEVVAALKSIDGVLDAHHVHAWELDENHRALEAHVVVTADDLDALETIKQRCKAVLQDRFAITHSTLEIELPSAGHEPDVVTEH